VPSRGRPIRAASRRVMAAIQRLRDAPGPARRPVHASSVKTSPAALSPIRRSPPCRRSGGCF